MGKLKTPVAGGIAGFGGKTPSPFGKNDPVRNFLIPDLPDQPDSPSPPVDPGPTAMPDPEDELLQQRKRQAAAKRQKTGRASTLLTEDRLGG